jgi:hypothetical protein
MKIYFAVPNNGLTYTMFGAWRDPGEVQAFAKEAQDRFKNLELKEYIEFIIPFLVEVSYAKHTFYDLSDFVGSERYAKVDDIEYRKEMLAKDISDLKIRAFELQGPMFESLEHHFRKYIK